ncbi:hypothetical protein M527_09885 [Sphingobium indicum IP26]|uniref:hypothetical protein n=1 Tax=Sphingobium indicum TaxID=332055 RepID=UPI0003789A46|nr:hypothetical protein M527_09885 [Sphingobium indicum IP26]
MAKLPALVTALAEVDGRDRKSVEHIGRTIREAGYIPTGKRGSGAAEMTPREASNFIIALNGADTPKDGPIAIDRFRSLRQYYKGTSKDFRAYVDSFEGQPEAMQDVADSRTFGEALEALINGVPSLVMSFHHFAKEQYPTNDGSSYWDEKLMSAFRLTMFGVEVEFERYAAKIDMFIMNGSERNVQCEVRFIQDQDRETGFYGVSWPDRRVRSTIGMPTLIAAWQALNPLIPLPGIQCREVRAADEHDDE